MSEHDRNPHGIHKLAWGYNPGLPEDYMGAAWGCRAIYTGYSGRGVDLVPDRQDAIGPREQVRELLDKLNGGINEAWMAAVERLPIRGNRAEEFVAYDGDGDGVVVKVNSLASYGYLYVVAYLTDDADT